MKSLRILNSSAITMNLPLSGRSDGRVEGQGSRKNVQGKRIRVGTHVKIEANDSETRHYDR